MKIQELEGKIEEQRITPDIPDIQIQDPLGGDQDSQFSHHDEEQYARDRKKAGNKFQKSADQLQLLFE